MSSPETPGFISPFTAFEDAARQRAIEMDELDHTSQKLEAELRAVSGGRTRLAYEGDRAIDQFLGNLSETPRLYRAVFEIALHGRDDKPTFERLTELDTQARHLLAFERECLSKPTEETTPALHLKLYPLTLRGSDGRETTRVVGMQARVASLDPNTIFNVTESVDYHFSRGSTHQTKAITLGPVRSTNISTSTVGFDDELVLDQPRPQHVTEDWPIAVAPRPFVTICHEKPQFTDSLESTLIVGRIAVEQTLDALQASSRSVDYYALDALSRAVATTL